MMRKDHEAGILPQVGSIRKTARCAAQQLVLLCTWVACCVLLAVMLLSELQYLPAVHQITSKIIMPSDFKMCTRHLRHNSATSSTHPAGTAVQLNSSNMISAEAAEAALESLWTEMAFTPVIKAADTKHEYGTPLPDSWQQQPGLNLVQAESLPPVQQQQPQQQTGPILPPLKVPELSHSDDLHIDILLGHVRDAVQFDVTAEEARLGYLRAFQSVPPLNPDSPWHVTPAAEWQQVQQRSTASDATAADTTISSSGSFSSRSGSSGPTQQHRRSDNATAAAQQLMTYGLLLLKSSNKLVDCGTDDSSMPPLQPEQPGGPTGGRVLLAAVLSDEGPAAAFDGATGYNAAGDAMPNFVLQVAMFAMQSKPEAVLISIVHDSSSRNNSGRQAAGDKVSSSSSSSSSSVSYWLDVLKLLLLPLRVPMLITNAAEALANNKVGVQAAGVQYKAALRNLAIDSFFNESATHCNSSSSSSTDIHLATSSSREQSTSTVISSSSPAQSDSDLELLATPGMLQQQLSSFRPMPAAVDSSNSSSYTVGGLGSSQAIIARSTTASGEPSTPDLARCFNPDWVLFIDSGVLFCKADLHRLLMHRQADMACGWDLRMAEPSAAAAAGAAAAPGTTPVAGAAVPPTVTAVISAASSNLGINSVAPAAAASTAAVAAAAAGIQGAAGVLGLLRPESTVGAVNYGAQHHTGLPLTASATASSSSSSNGDGSIGSGSTAPMQSTINNRPEAAATAAADPVAGVPRGILQQQVVAFGVLSPVQMQHQHQQHQLQLQQQMGQAQVQPMSAVTFNSMGMPASQLSLQPQQTLAPHPLNNSIPAQPATPLLQQQQQLPVPGRPHPSILHEFPFYNGDAVIGRMVTGQQFDVVPPYAASHMPTQSRLAAGLPVQVYCCWSGFAKLKAEPFKRGLRFRSRQLGECNTTAQNLLCDDLHRLGFSRTLMDSGVLVTRQLQLSARISNSVQQAQRMPYIRRSRWLEVQGAGSPWLLSQQQLRDRTYKSVACCGHSSAKGRKTTGSATGNSGMQSAGVHSSLGLSDTEGFSNGVQGRVSSIVNTPSLVPISLASTGLSSTGLNTGSAIKFLSSLYYSTVAAGTDSGGDLSAANISYPSRGLSVENFLAAAAVMPVGRAAVGQVAAAIRLPTADTGAVAAAGAGVQQCVPMDVMARNFTEGFLWQLAQERQHHQQRQQQQQLLGRSPLTDADGPSTSAVEADVAL